MVLPGEAKRFQWRWNWKIVLFSLALLPVLISLGFWQLERAEDKRRLQNLYNQRALHKAVPIGDVQPAPDIAFTRVRLVGQFDNPHSLLLDNRIRRGRVGYEVVTPFVTREGQTVLVNRGWLVGNPDRRVLPEVDAVLGQRTIEGLVYVPPGQALVLAQTELASRWPLVVQQIDSQRIGQILGSPVFPYTVRIDPTAEGALYAQWPGINTRPERHTGYAVQWFSMAFVLVLLTVLANSNLWQILKRPTDSDDT